MKGGPDNPIGARAMYLWQGNKDTLYRIHGTNEPSISTTAPRSAPKSSCSGPPNRPPLPNRAGLFDRR
jgi:hypothetical protein